MNASGTIGSQNCYKVVSNHYQDSLPDTRYIRTLLWLLGCWLSFQVAYAQVDGSRLNPQNTLPDSQTAPRVMDSVAAAHATLIADSISFTRDSVFYSRLKQRMYKRNLTRQLYDALFRQVYNSRLHTGEVKQIEVNPFEPYRGKIIGTIYVRRLNVFGQSVYDTLRHTDNWFERAANSVHRNTREGVIRRYLRFQEGDEVNPLQLQDNERLLRNTNIFHDARILIVSRPGSRQFIDVHIITQDVWSLLPDGGVGSLNNYSVGFEQRNVRGLGHQFTNMFYYNSNDPRQKAEYRARYTVPYIGRTFLTAQSDFLWLRDQKQVAVRLFRPFITPDTKWAGSFEMSYNRINNRVILPFNTDSTVLVGLSYNYSDVWLGRSFKVFFGNRDIQEANRARLVVAGRITNYTYLKRPSEVRADTNQLYQNTRLMLFSLGYSQRRYARDVLIYGFGRTEDVPYGNLISLVGGVDNAEFGRRLYGGANFSRGLYVKKLGYLYSLLNVGSYFRAGKAEQGLFSVQANYFSPLQPTKHGDLRHFVNFRYTAGFDRFNNEYVSLNDAFNVNNNALIGTKRLVLGYENVWFSQINLIGFRLALVSFANVGLVSFQGQPLQHGPVYQSYGVGFRFRNENLTVNSFQIRLTWYPNLPENRAPFRTGFDGTPILRFRDFDITAPQTVPFQ